MIDQELICNAIRNRNYVRLHCTNGHQTVYIVEPYALGKDHSGKLILTAWFWKGTIGQDSQGIKHYSVESIISFQPLSETFDRPQDGYNPVNAHFQSVVCDLVISRGFSDSIPADGPK